MEVSFNVLNGQQKGQFIFTEFTKLLFDDAVNRVMRGEIILTQSHLSLRQKCLHSKHFINLILSIASQQNHKNITFCEMYFQNFALLQFQSFLFSESKIHIPATCLHITQTLTACYERLLTKFNDIFSLWKQRMIKLSGLGDNPFFVPVSLARFHAALSPHGKMVLSIPWLLWQTHEYKSKV